MDKFPLTQFVKIGIVVRNIEKAVKEYSSLFNIPDPVINYPKDYIQEPGGRKPGTVFRGCEENPRIKTAVVKLAPIYIELIEPVDGNGPWTEFLEKKGPGVFFIAFESSEGFEDIEKLMSAKGMPIYHRTEKGFQRYGYFETAEQLGVTVEFKEIDKT